MIVVLDLDYTLFDAAAFKDGIAGVFGISEDVFHSTLEKYFKAKGLSFNPYIHLELLAKDGYLAKENEEAAAAGLHDLLSRSDDYLITGAKQALEDFRKFGFRLILVTHGDEHWQQAKIDALSIKTYFDRVIVTEGDKADEIDFLFSDKDKVALVNDDPEELYRMAVKLPRAEPYLIRGPYSEGVEDRILYHIVDIPKVLCR